MQGQGSPCSASAPLIAMHCRLQVFAGRGLSAASRIRRTEPANQRPALRLHGASKQAAHVEGGEGDGRRAGMPADATRQQQHDHGPAAAFVAAQLIACRAEPAAPEWGELRQVTVAQCSSSGRCCCWHARLLACTAATAVMAPDASRGMAGQLFCVHPAWPPACMQHASEHGLNGGWQWRWGTPIAALAPVSRRWCGGRLPVNASRCWRLGGWLRHISRLVGGYVDHLFPISSSAA